MRKKQGKRGKKKGRRRKRDRELDLAKQQELFPLPLVESRPMDYGPLFASEPAPSENDPAPESPSQSLFQQRELFE